MEEAEKAEGNTNSKHLKKNGVHSAYETFSNVVTLQSQTCMLMELTWIIIDSLLDLCLDFDQPILAHKYLHLDICLGSAKTLSIDSELRLAIHATQIQVGQIPHTCRL